MSFGNIQINSTVFNTVVVILIIGVITSIAVVNNRVTKLKTDNNLK